jgi:ketopantoate reductase
MMNRSNIVGMGALGLSLRSLIPSNCEVVFFCVKAFDLKEALLCQDSEWPIHVPFVTLSNGYLDELLGGVILATRRPLRVGVTTVGGFFDQFGNHQAINQKGSVIWGPFLGIQAQSNILPTSAEADLLQLNGSWRWALDPGFHQMQKWIMNAVINSITAAHHLSCNGDLLNHWGEVLEVMQEAVTLASRLWPRFEKELVGESALKKHQQQLLELVRMTVQNENSMARDVRLKRRTESEFLAGLSMRYTDLPRLRSLHTKIETLNKDL